MNFPFLIARKYFWSTSNKNFINIISIISMFVVGIATMALIIILSVFNGLEDLLKSLYGSFDPEIKIESRLGKSFEATDSLINIISSVKGIDEIVKVIEDNAYVRYNDAEMVVVIKGVSKNYLEVNKLEDKITEGTLKLWNGNVPLAVIGQGVQFALAASPENDFFSLQIFYPKNLRSRSINPNNTLSKKNIHISGVFAIERQFDEKYVLVPIQFASELMRYKNKLTSLEITTTGGQEKEVADILKSKLGERFKVLKSDEQHAVMLRTVKIEKFFVFLTFAFIIGVSSINIFFALSMLAIDKRRDIAMLFAMGAAQQQVSRIFLFEGMIISLTGTFLGLALGYIFIILQQEIGLIGMGLQTSVVNYYPIKIAWLDFLFTGLTITAITILASLRPAIIAARHEQGEIIL